MAKTSPVDEMTQQLDALSLKQLLEVRAKVDALIKEKSLLEKVIELVDEWINDESGYDEETYPHIEAALNQSRLSW